MEILCNPFLWEVECFSCSSDFVCKQHTCQILTNLQKRNHNDEFNSEKDLEKEAKNRKNSLGGLYQTLLSHSLFLHQDV